MKHIVITGVSTGIGKAAAEELIKHDYHVFGSVRKESDAVELQKKLGSNFTPLIFDVTDTNAIKSAAEKVKNEIGKEHGLDALINNAGIGIGGPLMHQSLEEIRYHFEVNVFGVISVTQAFLPLLSAQYPQQYKPGRIINISSVSGRLAFPFLGAYSSSKHALEAISDSLRRELMIYGIDVIVIEPGPVSTEIWNKAEKFSSIYENSDYISIIENFRKSLIENGNNSKPPLTVAKVILKALKSKHPKTRYVIPENWLTTWILPRVMPDRWLDKIIAKIKGFERMNLTSFKK